MTNDESGMNWWPPDGEDEYGSDTAVMPRDDSVYPPASDEADEPPRPVQQQESPKKSGSLGSLFGSGKKKPPRPTKAKPPKPPRTGPSPRDRAVSAGKRFGSDLTASLVEHVNWSGLIGLLLVASVVGLWWRHPRLLLHLTQVDAAVGVAVGLGLCAAMFWLALQARLLRRKTGAWYSLVAGVVLAVITVVAAAVYVRYPQWWPSVTVVAAVFLALTGLVHWQHRETVISEGVNERWNEVKTQAQGLIDGMSQARTSHDSMVRAVGSLYETADAHVTKLGEEREKIEQLTAATHAAATESHHAAVSIKGTAEEQERDIEEKVESRQRDKEQRVVNDWRTKGLRDAAEEVDRRIAEAVKDARHQEQGKAQSEQLELIERMKREQVEPVKQENTELRRQVEQQQQEIRRLQSSLGAYQHQQPAPARPADPTSLPRQTITEAGEWVQDPYRR